jgi:hypothetical protein
MPAAANCAAGLRQAGRACSTIPARCSVRLGAKLAAYKEDARGTGDPTVWLYALAGCGARSALIPLLHLFAPSNPGTWMKYCDLSRTNFSRCVS